MPPGLEEWAAKHTGAAAAVGPNGPHAPDCAAPGAAAHLLRRTRGPVATPRHHCPHALWWIPWIPSTPS
eukprot:1153246-Pelagomonas_calceolata.AAC.4